MSGAPSVVVTGAARGIGEATARAFLAAGYRVGAFDLAPVAWADEMGDGVAGELVTAALDVTDPQAWERALAEFCGPAGRLDVLVNNAGLLYGSAFAEGSFERDSALVDVNVKGVLYGCRAAFGYLRAARPAAVVNLCSASAIYGQPELATYSATKFAVRGLTEALELEWAGQGVRVAAVWPLFVDTGMIAGVETTSMSQLGVKLTAHDVAREIVALAGRRGEHGRRRAEVHHPVGRQARLLHAAADLAPSWLVRASNRRLVT